MLQSYEIHFCEMQCHFLRLILPNHGFILLKSRCFSAVMEQIYRQDEKELPPMTLKRISNFLHLKNHFTLQGMQAVVDPRLESCTHHVHLISCRFTQMTKPLRIKPFLNKNLSLIVCKYPELVKILTYLHLTYSYLLSE